jgi:hypothetical protein
MSYYWETLYGKDELLAILRSNSAYMLFDCRDDPVSDSMYCSYLSFAKRDYQLYNNGSCLGYTTTAIVEQLLNEGKLVRRKKTLEIVAS